MAIKVKNISTGEVVQVKNVNIADDGVLVSDVWAPRKSKKFFEIYPMMVRTDRKRMIEFKGSAVECDVLELAEGWEVDTTRKQRKPRQPKVRTPQPEPQPEPTEDFNWDDFEKDEPTPAPQPKFEVGGLEGGLAQVFAPVFNQVAAQIEANIRAKVDAEMRELKRIADTKARKLEITLPDGKKTKVEGLTMDGFDDMVKDLAAGYNIYMYGPAGTGKSHTAKQLAAALGVPYYEINQVEFAHEVTGYGDATGRYVSTPLYEAVVNGGLCFFDEFDRSAQSATTVVNTLLANRRFTFPVIGNVEAHPNFRVVAAGNTTMTGASNEYVAANVIDASSRDRFIFYKTYYDERIELPVMAKDDKDLVTFMQELRKAADMSHVQLVASMRATDYLKNHENDKVNALQRGLFKGMEPEDIRILYNHLSTKGMNTEWAKTMEYMC